MSTKVSSQQELYDIYQNEVLANTSELTDFSEGSLHDIIAGAMTTAQNEISELIVDQFSKTFFDLASGPTENDPTDYIQILAIDHFGDSFARPVAVSATGEIQFSRPNFNAGLVNIPIGTVVKTEKDANGVEIRFLTQAAVVMGATELTKTAQIKASIEGTQGNVTSGKLIVLESTLTDPLITVNNISAMAGGSNAPDDATYRTFIRNKILALAGATEAAVKGAILAVSGVSFAQLITRERIVIDYDIGTGDILIGSTYFRMPYPVAYIADSLGNSSQALIDAVKLALIPVKAAGVRIEVLGAVPVSIGWTASLTLNVSGPNFAELSVDLSKIIETMTDYINTELEIGDDFVKASANAYVMSIWGPAGTNDITSFSSSIPSGNVSVAANQKAVAGTIQVI
jgi:hypothetical protein